VALELMGDEPGALASFRHAADIGSGFAQPRGALALSALRERRPTEARLFAEAALACDANDPSARTVLGRLALDGQDPAAALAWLEPAIRRGGATPSRQAASERLAADALDALGRKGEAFDLYAAAAGRLRRLHQRTCGGPSPLSGLDLCQALVQGYGAAPETLWRPAPGSQGGGEAGHVFVVGFPRSGTTLLEQALAGHPDIVTLEERPTLLPAIERYLDPPTGLGALADLDEAAAEDLRRDYWARVRAFGVEPGGKVFVDKQPFYSLWLPLIVKLFPDARLVIPRRDPRDVVLSCFRRRFGMNGPMYQLLTLAGGAAFYDAAMQIGERLPIFGLPHLIVRHESLVEDFDATVREVCGFLDMPFTEAMRGFAGRIQDRGVATPSGVQVSRGLTAEGIGAWRRYADQMAEVLPVLEPWARRFGYPAA
jgi:tetratricopeptide (TPR) repeat protein